MLSSEFDIVIVGGGMVGLAMVASLAELGLKILLVERQSPTDIACDKLLANENVADKNFDVRVSAISPGNRNWLTQLAVWQNIPQQRLANYAQMNVWDGDGTGSIEFSASSIAQPDLGVILENRVLQAALLKNIEAFGHVHCLFGVELEMVNTTEQYAEVVLSDGSHFKGSLLIGADGANSVVRQKVGIESKQSDYQQVAFVMNVATERAHQYTAWQRFIPTGPVAFLPLANERLCSVVWSLDQTKAEQMNHLDRFEFVTKLQNAFESKLGKLTAVSDFSSFPLVKRHSLHYLSNRVALVGDAAHTIHPLAGQGVNLGFQDVACLSSLIGQLYQQQRDFGLVQNLRPFERERKAQNVMMQNAMSGFKHLFANQSLPVTLIRNFAMSALNRMPIAKEIIIKKAMGI